jgi:hypothetical protein
MRNNAQPEIQPADDVAMGPDGKQTGADPVQLRHSQQAELGAALRDYYTAVVEQPLPERLVLLAELFRQKEQNE